LKKEIKPILRPSLDALNSGCKGSMIVEVVYLSRKKQKPFFLLLRVGKKILDNIN